VEAQVQPGVGGGKVLVVCGVSVQALGEVGTGEDEDGGKEEAEDHEAEAQGVEANLNQAGPLGMLVLTLGDGVEEWIEEAEAKEVEEDA